ncbi:MAG: glycoside hydrolase family 1 protein, partial [Candidatus Methylumidiphilus sp.]
AMLAARRYGDRVRRWATFNEQSVSTLFGYAWGWSPPAVADRAVYYRTVHHQNLAHGAAIDVLRAAVSGASLGIVHNRQVVYPEGHDPAHQHVVEPMDAHWNNIFPDPQILGHYPPSVAEDIEPYVQAGDLARICRPLDWFGLNHYGPLWANSAPGSVLGFGMGGGPQGTRLSEIGWAVEPDAFRRELLDTFQRYKLPVYVTENGCGSDKETPDAEGFVDDAHRISYLQDYMAALSAAVTAGADVRGYFIWSLLDNFEWGSGYAFRFGIHRVDYDTLQRTPKASAYWYADLIRANSDAES